ncbi:hypothetical protein C3492_26970 [Streptomyces sp. Ru62]|nr:hypothetical protein C3492_26970 [Streptomyces sp. Ru62]
MSFPGLGVPLCTRVPAEIGDDKARFTDAGGLKAYAGASPITRAFGKESSITLGRLYHYLQDHTLFEEQTAFPTALAAAA